MSIANIFYLLKPLIPRSLQIIIRKQIVRYKRKKNRKLWPIDYRGAEAPPGFKGWPTGKKFAFILTHDVETQKGLDNCLSLARVEYNLGLRSSFNFVPRRYRVDWTLRDTLFRDGFEIGVHGLYHDGKLYNSYELFLDRAKQINGYLKEWNAVGFRSPSMQHNLAWLHNLNIKYDASTFDTDPFEPQPDGVCTIFPFWVPSNINSGGFVELPYTLAQDFTLFVLMEEKTTDIWKQKLDWIVENGGMALINTHPDYMSFNKGNPGVEEYPIEYYEELLRYITCRYEGHYWHVLPKDLSSFWSEAVIN